MTFNFTIRYTDGAEDFDKLDYYYGAQSLFGMSQILLISLNAFLNKEIITQAPSAKGFSLVLGVSKRGSWEQVIELAVSNPSVQAMLDDLGKNVIYDLLKYVIASGVGIHYFLKHRKSVRRMRELERENDDLHEKLDEALKRAHAPVKHQGLNIQVMSGRTILATFDKNTLQYIETEVINDETEIIECAINRFNTRTGNGRLINAFDANSIPFFPADKLSRAETTRLADNLAQLARENFIKTKLLVSSTMDGSGKLKRYRLHRVMEAK